MVVLIVVLTIIIFFVVDLVLRITMRKMHETKLRKKREEALDVGLKLDFTDEADSLKRVEVDNPKAKILAVDDEEIVLSSFRKILVYAGYSIDTVESGQEALGLIQKYDYDFVFTDLKMPNMDGVEVTKAVKHLRPDIDVIVITGYATIETAVETMKFGAMDYVEKPFTEDELVDFIENSLIKREDKIDKQMRPSIRLVTPCKGESDSKSEFNVPAGFFISSEHTWINIEMNGTVRIGLDDFVRKIIGKFDEVSLPNIGDNIQRGDTLFIVRFASQSFEIPSPISGKVNLINMEHKEHPEWIAVKPFELTWMCCIEPTNLSLELQSFRIGADSLTWYEAEIEKYEKIANKIAEANSNGKIGANENKEKIWAEFSKSFLHKNN